MKMHVIAILNTKGGVAKTITTVHLGAALAAAGQRVLLVDLDPRHGLTTYFDLDPATGSTTDVLIRGRDLEAATQMLRHKLFIVPAAADLEGAEAALMTAAGGELRLRRALKGLTGYHFVLLDCGGQWGMVTRNALVAAGSLILPVMAEPLALVCAQETDAARRELADYHDHEFRLLGVLVTRWSNSRVTRSMADQIAQTWGKAVFETKIRQAARVNELAVYGETIGDVSVSAGGVVGEDYRALAGEVMARCRKLSRT